MPRVELPTKIEFLFKPSRYKVAYGGRGGAKSWSFARVLIVMAAKYKLRILCVREIQNSIRESVHRLLKDQIFELGYQDVFRITDSSITCINGSEFIFAGIRTNVSKVRSMEGIDICWVEEAEAVSEDSWAILIPTIRKTGSEIWASFNPDQATDPTYKRFVTNRPPKSIVVEIGWEDNPWLPEELRAEKDYLYSVDSEAADHVWGGKTRQRSKAEILGGKWVVQAFEPQDDWHGPYQGADWGFATDPSTLVRVWVSGDPEKMDHTLWIERERYGIGVDNDELPAHFDKIEEELPKDKDELPNILARTLATEGDNARPETISHMKRHGYPRMRACKKWSGSVEDGIRHLRGYKKIVIHPRCTHAIEEARLYSYKTDKLTGEVLPVIIDKHNHIWDPVRYALGPLIRSGIGRKYRTRRS